MPNVHAHFLSTGQMEADILAKIKNIVLPENVAKCVSSAQAQHLVRAGALQLQLIKKHNI